MEICLATIFGILGAVIGSFLNVCVDRLPASKSLIYPASHCDTCSRKLELQDLVPILSYLAVKGRCRSCRAKIPKRVFWVELGTGVFTALLFLYKGFSIEFAFIALFSYLYIVIALIDLHHKLILNKVIYPSLIAALIIAPFFIKQDTLGSNVVDYGITNALIGGVTGFIFLLIPALVFRGGMGFGDIKMSTLIGLTTGFGEVLVALLLGIILGGITGIIFLITGVKNRKETIPFGPFLALSAIVTLILGTDILSWYMSLFV
ncbi:MAG: prepilin peptidase, partial [Eubacteriales bacterium]